MAERTLSAVQTEFLRLEEKFLIPIANLNHLKKLIEKNMEPKWDHYHVRSIYFDSINLDLFSQHIQNLDQRYKLRLRTYSKNSDFQDDVFFAEYKKKDNGLTEKKRFQIDSNNRDSVMKGNSIADDKVVLHFNQDTKPKRIKKVVSSVNKLMETYHLIPMMQVSYERFAAEKDGLRLTIDDHLEFVPIQNQETVLPEFDSESERRFQHYKDAYHPETHVVLEVKHMNNFPTWLSEFLNETLILPARFSKYIWATGNVLKVKESK